MFSKEVSSIFLSLWYDNLRLLGHVYIYIYIYREREREREREGKIEKKLERPKEKRKLRRFAMYVFPQRLRSSIMSFFLERNLFSDIFELV